MSSSSLGPAIGRIAAGFAVGATIGFLAANATRGPAAAPAPAGATEVREARQSGAPSEGGSGASAADDAEPQLSDRELSDAMAAVDARPDDFEAQYKMAEALLRISRRPSDAIRYYERAVTLQPRSAEALVGLGDANFATALEKGEDGHYDSALLEAAQKAYERAIAVAPGSASIYAALGLTFSLRTPPVPARARAAFDRALALDPGNALARRGLADLDKSAGAGRTPGATPSPAMGTPEPAPVPGAVAPATGQ